MKTKNLLLPLALATFACQGQVSDSEQKALPFACASTNISEDFLPKDQASFLKAILSSEQKAAYSNFIVLGDSFSDTGRLGRKTFDALVPRCLFWENRFSNGPVWADYVVGASGWNTYNYAVSGAETRDEHKASSFLKILDYLNPFALHETIQDVVLDPLLAQVDQLERDDRARNFDREKSVVAVWIGTNNYWKHGTEDERHGKPQLDRVQLRVNSIKSDIKEAALRLQGLGFQQIVLVNLAELGGLERPADLPKMASDATNHEYTLRHNAALEELKDELNRDNFRVAVMDAYALDKQAREQPRSLGLESGEACYKGNIMGFSPPFKAAVCKNPLAHRQWDRIHPNTRMHCHYAVTFFQTLQNAGVIEGLDHERLTKKCLSMQPAQSFF